MTFEYIQTPQNTMEIERRLRDVFEELILQAGDAGTVWRAALAAMQTLRQRAGASYGERIGDNAGLDPLRVVAAVADAHGLDADVIVSANRSHRVSRARRHAMWELHLRRPDMSLLNIAGWLGRVCHATTVYNLRKATEEIEAGCYEKERALVERALS